MNQGACDSIIVLLRLFIMTYDLRRFKVLPQITKPYNQTGFMNIIFTRNMLQSDILEYKIRWRRWSPMFNFYLSIRLQVSCDFINFVYTAVENLLIRNRSWIIHLIILQAKHLLIYFHIQNIYLYIYRSLFFHVFFMSHVFLINQIYLCVPEIVY